MTHLQIAQIAAKRFNATRGTELRAEKVGQRVEIKDKAKTWAILNNGSQRQCPDERLWLEIQKAAH